MRTVAVLLDGGHLRTYARKAGKAYDPPFIERFGRACVKGDQTLQRILYYDCAPYTGSSGHEVRPAGGTTDHACPTDQLPAGTGIVRAF